MKMLSKLRARLRRNDQGRAEQIQEQTRLRLEREGRGLPGAETHSAAPDLSSRFGGGVG